jgi:hypothetical protein
MENGVWEYGNGVWRLGVMNWGKKGSGMICCNISDRFDIN